MVGKNGRLPTHYSLVLVAIILWFLGSRGWGKTAVFPFKQRLGYMAVQRV
ncbi:MAG: hypothetical protein R3C62_05705 [Chloroflexota bacterium]